MTNNTPVLGQTISDFTGMSWIYLGKVDEGIVVKCPVTLHDYIFSPFIFGMTPEI